MIRVGPRAGEAEHQVAVAELHARYADAVSTRSWDAFDDLFVPGADVHLDLVTSPPRTVTGSDDIAAFIADSIARFDHFTFVVLNAVADLTPATEDGPPTGTGRLLMCEIRHETATDTWTEAHGLYRDRLELHDGTWRYAERRYRSLARRGPGGRVLGLPSDLRT